MKNILDLFADKNIRAICDKSTRKWWFSTVDICAAILDCDHTTARKYLAWLRGKQRTDGVQSTSHTRRLNFPAANGRAHFTDAMDVNEIVRLVMIMPSPKAVPLRLWLADLLIDNADIASQFAQVGEKSSLELEKILLQTTIVTDIL